MSIGKPVYLDHSATTPVNETVLEAMLPYFTSQFGNASSRHHFFGSQAYAAVENAREQTADLINCEPAELVFTSGATESINLAIKGVFEMYATKGNHIIASPLEHKAVLDCLNQLEKRGAEISYLPVKASGEVDLAGLKNMVRDTTILIILMHANNETGVMMPVEEAGGFAKENGILFFTDATQSAGKTGLDVSKIHCDLLSLSAHKMYGPKGIGALYVRRRSPRVRLKPLLDGGGHERGFRSGTLNVPGIVGLGAACALASSDMNEELTRLSGLRNSLEQALTGIEGIEVNGLGSKRLSHISNLYFKGAKSDLMLLALKNDLAVSSGSACTSGTLEPSYVLKAMGMEDERAYSSLRVSLGRMNTGEEIEFAGKIISEAYNKLKPD